MKQEEKIAMGLVNIPNGLLEQVSKDGMSMLFGGENSGDVDFFKQINHGANCDVINNGGTCDVIINGANCDVINNKKNCGSINNQSLCHIVRHF